ncbi:MAG: n-acetylglutamate synthase [Ferruginibacter sp.]|nr:n-acetylglutamate synthase [Ferruginibacter sp.]
MISYDNKTFRSCSNSLTGEVDGNTIFHYRQEKNIVTGTYSGGKILSGQLIALVDQQGRLDMRYQHINQDGDLMTGKCISTPVLLPTGKLRIHEVWEWTSGDLSAGESLIEEL